MVLDDPRYLSVTSEFLQALDRGLPAWKPPWPKGTDNDYRHGGWPHRGDGSAFRGDNLPRLWAAAREDGHTFPTWLTAMEILASGGSLEGDGRGVPVRVAYGAGGSSIDSGTGHAGSIDAHLFREVVVYNVSQISGLPARYYRQAWDLMPNNRDSQLSRVDRFFREQDVDLVHQVAPDDRLRAAFEMKTAQIQMPPWQIFNSAWDYYVTLAHEVVHWARFVDGKFDQSVHADNVLYAREDMIAEVGAVFLCADLGFSTARVGEEAPYFAEALEVLGEPRAAVLVAADAAAETVGWLHQQVPGYRAGMDETYRRTPLPGEVDDDGRGVMEARDARRWVAEAASVLGRHSARDAAWIAGAVSVLDRANRIDLDLAAVRTALEAAAILQGAPAPVRAEDYIEDVRQSLSDGIGREVADIRRDWRRTAASTGMRF